MTSFYLKIPTAFLADGIRDRNHKPSSAANMFSDPAPARGTSNITRFSPLFLRSSYIFKTSVVVHLSVFHSIMYVFRSWTKPGTMPGPEDTKINTAQFLPLGNHQSSLGERCENKISPKWDDKLFMEVIPAYRQDGAESKGGFLFCSFLF